MRFELGTSGVGSNCSTFCATTTTSLPTLSFDGHCVMNKVSSLKNPKELGSGCLSTLVRSGGLIELEGDQSRVFCWVCTTLAQNLIKPWPD